MLSFADNKRHIRERRRTVSQSVTVIRFVPPTPAVGNGVYIGLWMTLWFITDQTDLIRRWPLLAVVTVWCWCWYSILWSLVLCFRMLFWMCCMCWLWFVLDALWWCACSQTFIRWTTCMQAFGERRWNKCCVLIFAIHCGDSWVISWLYCCL